MSNKNLEKRKKKKENPTVSGFMLLRLEGLGEVL
jgi:hypothetical protein